MLGQARIKEELPLAQGTAKPSRQSQSQFEEQKLLVVDKKKKLIAQQHESGGDFEAGEGVL